MNHILLLLIVGLLGSLLLGAVAVFRKPPVTGWFRVVGALSMIAPIPFFLFAFAAAFEPGEYNWVFRVAYGIVLLGCVGGLIRLCWPRNLEAPAPEADPEG